MDKIAIVGAGGFGREVLTLVQAINKEKERYEILGFIDNLQKGTMINGYPVIGTDDEINETKEEVSVVLSVGDARLKNKIRNKYTNPKIKFPTLIHPSVFIGDDNLVKIGQGCIICATCALTTNIVIKDFVTLNLQCTVGHDTIINDYCSFMPGCHISGKVHIEEGVCCGTGVKIIDQTNIGKYTIVGAGAVVTKSLPDNCTAVGMPAKPIKYR